MQFEIRTAIKLEKRLVLVHETEGRDRFDFVEDKKNAPADLASLLDHNESLPFRRREYERQAMLEMLIDRASYTASVAEDANSLAPIPIAAPSLPSVISERKGVLSELRSLLLDSGTSDKISLSSVKHSKVAAHGAGGVG